MLSSWELHAPGHWYLGSVAGATLACNGGRHKSCAYKGLCSVARTAHAARQGRNQAEGTICTDLWQPDGAAEAVHA